MGGMSKGIDCLQLRFSEFLTVYDFAYLLWATGWPILKVIAKSLLLAPRAVRLIKALKLN
jgi:hypothetical protein